MSNWYTIPNLSSSQVTKQVPWEFTPDIPERERSTKEKYRDWLARPSTNHCLYSCVEGLLSGIRISKENPIIRIHGLIIDYDTKISEELLNESLANRPGEFSPNHVHTTFSGGRRLIWLFQSPALVATMDMARHFLSIAAKKTRAKNFLAGIDMEALSNPTTYYDIGTQWRELDTRRIPEEFVFTWLFEAGNLANRKEFDGPAIPIDVLAAEVEKRFPGRWPGEFIPGASGPRFWDSSADNPRACVINKYGTGMQCFTGATSFMSWKAIFGVNFTEKYKAESLGEVMIGTWFDGQYYWRKTDKGEWMPWQKEDFKLYLRVHHHISAGKKPNSPSSEMDDVIFQLHEQKRVQGAFPYVYYPDGPIRIDNETFLNISTVKTLSPAPEGSVSDWGNKFPWLAEFFDVFFDEPAPRSIFLGWLQRAYLSGHFQDPHPGQVVLIAGETSRGKTLLSTVIVSRMLGGSADASRYFLGEESFTYHILKKPLMTVDDTVPTTSAMRHTRYSAMLKKIAANSEHDYERKFKDAGKIRWMGRVIITCNTDPESIRLLPSMDISNADKISLFRCNMSKEYPLSFPERQELSKRINEELPYFCRWLMEWKLPEVYAGDNRMGVVSYHDAHLLDSAAQTETSFGFLEILQLFLRSYVKVQPATKVWKGTATDLMAQICMDESLRPLIGKMTPTAIARSLGQLKAKGFSIDAEHTRLRRLWHISVALANFEEGKEL